MPTLRFLSLPVLWSVHRWFGWTLGAVFALIGLAGSVLVIKDTVDARLNPSCYVQGGGPGAAEAGAPSVADVLRAAYAGAAITDVDTVFLPERPGDPWVLRAERDDEDVEVFVRYDASAVLCARIWDDTFIGVASRFHTALLIPFDIRHEVVAVLAAGDALLLAAGLLLYLRQRRALRQGGRQGGRQGTRPRWARLHAWLGIAAALLLPVPLITGITMAVPDLARDVMQLALPFAEPPPRIKPARRSAPSIGPDAAIEAALAAIPGAKPRAVVLPALEGAPYRVFVRPPGDGRTRSGGSASVLVGPARAEAVAVVNPLSAPLGDQVFATRFPLHTGEMWNAPGRAVAFLSGMMPAVLFGTAFAGWRARRRRTASNRSRNLVRQQETQRT